ncbi:urea ABC transporter permease subunit UrtB [Endozoicomonas sp. 8E]|uniref:urea ABC transporter permease subunit UrtB n=1 Tax=Endozoicomonas sp. 8E TaxID=3035692 RepID=UPI00293914F7|nr:urea ABC transporter permease subunit UrtB [Endozoicomonas sp. 8E]WOG28668.1 urea ABC transporter permease subunit UrtB [Endozoicomonas sp. 8E]
MIWRLWQVLPLVCLCLLFVFVSSPQALANSNITSNEELARQLSEKSWDKLETTITRLSAKGDDESQKLLTLWLSGQLFIEKSTGRLISGNKSGRLYLIADPITDEVLGEVKKRSLKKIRINNRLRNSIRTALALWDLKSEDPEKRLQAVKETSRNLQADTLAILKTMLEKESDEDVHSALTTAVALYQIQQGSDELKIQSLEILSESDDPFVRSALESAKTETRNKDILLGIDTALADMDRRQEYYSAIESVFFGLSLGSVLLLAAIGLAITFGVMGVINMAHGEMMMLGAYTTFVIQSAFPSLLEQSLFIAIPAAFVVAGSVGILIERLVIRHLYGRPLETLLATFGISLILQQAVRTVFSPLNQAVSTPEWLSGSWVINEALSLTWNRVYIIGFSLAVFLTLLFILRYTRFGLNVRAVTQNRAMANSMGIPTHRIDALTFGLGSGIAGVAGVALSQLTNVGPNLGQNYIIDSFMVVVFGGVGNLWGTLVAAMSLGVVNKLLEPWAGAVVAKILVLIFIILFIQKRPKGLFALKGRAVED